MDIDIDVKDNKHIKELLKEYMVSASMIEDDELKSHPVGIYLQNIPKDALTGLSAIPYTEAENLGYTKIDILNLNLLDIFESRKELEDCIEMEPDWNILKNEYIVSKLFHISKHFDVVNKVKPSCIEDLADILALIRPNKRNLLPEYLKDKYSTRKVLYEKNEASDLRKSHAISYAMNIVLQMNLLRMEKLNV